MDWPDELFGVPEKSKKVSRKTSAFRQEPKRAAFLGPETPGMRRKMAEAIWRARRNKN